MSGYSVHEMFSVCPPSYASSQLRPPSPFLASFPFHIFVVPLGPEFLFPDRMFTLPKWPWYWESSPLPCLGEAEA